MLLLLLCRFAMAQLGQTKALNQRAFGQQWGFQKTVGVNDYNAQSAEFGIDSIAAEWFVLCLHSGSLAEYLDKQSQYVDFYGQTNGTWTNGDMMLFSVEGNSYRMNRIYKDGFRIDSRFMPGVTPYKFNMTYHNLAFDTHQSRLNLESANYANANYVSTMFDVSGLFGGPDVGSRKSGFYPTDRSFTPIGGEVDFQYNIEDRKTVRYFRTFCQHAYADGGMRRIVSLNKFSGVNYAHDYYYHVQADGEVPMSTPTRKVERRDMVRMYYLINASRKSGGQEFGFNINELYTQDYYTASIYFRNPEWNTDKYRLFGLKRPTWTMGITYGMGMTLTNNFSRSMVDIDGVGYEPWQPKGMNHELSYSCNISYDIKKWLRVRYDGFNSLIFYHGMNKNNQTNEMVWFYEEMESGDRYTVNWDSRFMYGALLENTVGLEAHFHDKKKFSMHLVADFTLDGFIQADKKSVVRPNWQLEAALNWRPNRIFSMGLTIGNYRIPFSLDDMRFFSNGWNTGLIYNSHGELFSTTGGKYHTINGYLQQPQYVLIDLPIKVALGRHEISFNTVAKKFYHLWTVNYDRDLSEYGYMLDGTFFEQPSEKYYVVDYRPLQSDNFFTNTPYYLSNVIKYAYNGDIFLFSASWQSTLMAYSFYGNDVRAMDLMTLSEPTPLTVCHSPYATRQAMPYATLRVMTGINTKHWRVGLLFKYLNGRPKWNYNLTYDVDEDRLSYSAGTPLWTDPVFDVDVNIIYRNITARNKVYELKLVGYNLFDYGSKLAGDAFGEGLDLYLLTRPRGLMFTMMLEI